MSDHLNPQSPTAPDVPTSEIERLLCAPTVSGSLDTLLPRSANAWSMRLPSLASFAAYPVGRRKPRICIATEEILGPVRNGGIGTTYAALANVLAQAGFDVTVLYLRGLVVETETIEHWVAHYAEKGVKLVPAPDYATAERFQSSSDRWLNGPYNMLRYLIDNPMDVVHVSEWRGCGYLSMLAKRQGIALRDTLFVVKTSSPWMWNRLYGAQALPKADDITKIQGERRSVELADVVVGGSLHLLRWMTSQGYQLPPARAFVQPNVATFTDLEPLMESRALPPGERTPVDEIVFFGRLESRKGLFVFCQAIRRLIRKGVPLPQKITFMGKPGGRMPSHPDIEVPDYIREVTENWPVQVDILTGFQQFEAIEYLLGGARLAVMPSIIENSSMAVYEAAICGIPCVATDVGGNAELIDEADHAAVLCQPHPVSLGDKLEEALMLGGMVPRPSFDNKANLETWRRFHRQLGGKLRQDLLAQARADAAAAAVPAVNGGTAVCIYYTGDDEALGETLASLAMLSHRPREIIVGIDAEHADSLAGVAHILAVHGLTATMVEAFDLDAGTAFNVMAERASSDYALFLWEGATLVPSALATLESIGAANGAEVLAFLHRVQRPGQGDDDQPDLRAVILGGTSDSYFRHDTAELPLFVRRQAFLGLDGFTGDYRVIGYDHEFVAKAQIAGLCCETAMMELGAIRERSPDTMRLRGYDHSASGFRVTRPKLAATPLAIRDLLLYARGLHLRTVPGAGKAKLGADAANPESVLVRMIAGLSKEPRAKEPHGGESTKPQGAGLAKTRQRSADADQAKSAANLPREQKVKPARAVTTSRSAPADSASRSKSGGSQKSATTSKPGVSDKVALLEGARVRTPVGRSAKLRKEPESAMSEVLRALIEQGKVGVEGKVMGQLLGVLDRRIYGWAKVQGNTRRQPGVELTIHGSVLSFAADHHFAPFAAVPPEAAGHGFVIDLPSGGERQRNGTPYLVRVAGSTLVLGEGLAMAPNANIDRCGVDAMWEQSDAGLIQGWAWYPDQAERVVELAAFVNGAILGRFRADRQSSQFSPAGDRSGAHAFEFAVPRLLQEAGRHRLDLVVAPIGVPLRQSPGWVQGMRVEVPRRRKWGVLGR